MCIPYSTGMHFAARNLQVLVHRVGRAGLPVDVPAKAKQRFIIQQDEADVCTARANIRASKIQD
jgi:hypothetical protein